MKLAISPLGEQLRNLPDELSRIRAVTDCDFHNIDFSFWHMKPDSSLMGDDWAAAASALYRDSLALGAHFVQAHSTEGNPLDAQTADWIAFSCARELQCCAVMKAPHLVVHCGTRNGIGREEFVERNSAFYRKLIPYIEETGVQVLVENIGNVGEDPYYLVTAEDMLAMLDAIGHPGFHVLWDIGHANINGLNQYEQITKLGKELHGVHVHDNFCRMVATGNGWLKDAHMLPGFGTVNFDAVLQGLLDIGYTGCFTFEVNAPMCYERIPFSRGGETVDRLSMLPLEIRQDVIRLLYKTGRFFLSQYGCFEE